MPEVINQLIDRLGQDTRTRLSSPDYDFYPFLPGEEGALPERIAALRSWCDWFNIGFAAGFMRPQTDISAELMEILHDFGELANVDDLNDDVSDHDEVDFMELTEYVRMAAICLFQQLNIPAVEEDEDFSRPEQLFADPDEQHFH